MLDQPAIFINMLSREASITAVMNLTNIKDACKSVQTMKETGLITAAFERKGKGKATYSHRQHTKTETK